MGKLREGLASSAPRLTGHELNRRRDLLDSLQRKERSLRDVVSGGRQKLELKPDQFQSLLGRKPIRKAQSFVKGRKSIRKAQIFVKVSEAPRGGGARDQLLGR